MAVPLYYENAYVQAFASTVTEVVRDEAGARVALAQTAFYPGGGGQPNDLGAITIAGTQLGVEKVKKEGDQIWHWLAGGDPDNVAVGAIVQGQTRLGAALPADAHAHGHAHPVRRGLARLWGAGDRREHGPGEGRMDFEFASLSRELIQAIEARCNVEVAAARPVRTQILPRAEAFAIPDLIRTKINLLPEGIQEIRTVEIMGLDLQADGGTHVANTQEVGQIRVVDYKSKGAINKRIYIELG